MLWASNPFFKFIVPLAGWIGFCGEVPRLLIRWGHGSYGGPGPAEHSGWADEGDVPPLMGCAVDMLVERRCSGEGSSVRFFFFFMTPEHRLSGTFFFFFLRSWTGFCPGHVVFDLADFLRRGVSDPTCCLEISVFFHDTPIGFLCLWVLSFFSPRKTLGSEGPNPLALFFPPSCSSFSPCAVKDVLRPLMARRASPFFLSRRVLIC